MPAADHPEQLWPDRTTVETIDALLRDRWLLNFRPNVRRIKARHPGTGPLLDRYDHELNRVLAQKQENGESDETELFKLLAHPAVFAIAGTHRRHYILDGIALALGVLRRFDLQGAVLDVGCHVGATLDILSRLTPNRFVGIDPLPEAVATASRATKGRANVELHVASLPWQSTSCFDLVLCYNVIEHMPEPLWASAIASLGGLLRDGGVLLLSEARFHIPGGQAAFSEARLGYVAADLFGGFGGLTPDWENQFVLVLRKGDGTPIPMEVGDLASSQWAEHFVSYCNSPDTPDREKTQCFERAGRNTRPP